MKTYKVYLGEEMPEQEISAEKVGVAEDGHLLFTKGEGEESLFLAGFSPGYWISFKEIEESKLDVTEEASEELVTETVVDEVIEEPVVEEPVKRPITEEERKIFEDYQTRRTK